MTETDRRRACVAARNATVSILRRELVGPSLGATASQTGIDDPAVAREEILRAEDPPRVRYGAGILFPRKVRVNVQEQLDAPVVSEPGAPETTPEDDAAAGDGERRTSGQSEADTEQEVGRANEYLPSAMGLTALVSVPEALVVTVEAARYKQVELKGRSSVARDGNIRPYLAWRRIPIHRELTVEAEDLLAADDVVLTKDIISSPDGQVLALHVYSRRLPGDAAQRRRMVTFTLLNQTDDDNGRADERCFFQVGFSVRGAAGEACFNEYPRRSELAHLRPASGGDNTTADREDASLRLLYRHRRNFAVGHGCSADWDGPSGGTTSGIRTETIPTYEIPPVLPSPRPELTLDMVALSDPGGRVAEATAAALCTMYAEWVDDLRRIAESDDSVDGDLHDAAMHHIADANYCLERLRRGHELLQQDWRARFAFEMMNRAMAMQRAHYKLSSEHPREWSERDGVLELNESYAEPDYPAGRYAWYPFQFAFMLMNLPSMMYDDDIDRSLVDVIWFPTGGGKTEAYLGLSALAILLRRLRGGESGGTTVLMRYTLRLLTTQQYQRAASLICALEHLRREDTRRLGEAPITIGLWVGAGLTPNSEDDAIAALRRMSREGGSDNPFVLLQCPWCGAGMGAFRFRSAYQVKGYREAANPRRVRHMCEDPDCPFSGPAGLPVLVVDEAMYAEPPTLVIGTVDKFALLPWKPNAAAFFGGGSLRPPELIVQDELHLISGPLGSMVGHYETLLEELCRVPDGTPVKIVASTATISRATDQVLHLYGRDRARLFPPQGLRWGESFFAEEREDLPGRLYAGVFATGLPSQQTALIRTSAALLQAPLLLDEEDPAVLDTFWSLMAYFNSIRELGAAATLVSADIREYLGVLQERLGLSYRWTSNAQSRRMIGRRQTLELTSRVSRGEISEGLAQLFHRYDGSAGSAVDVCLATNMIQVGLDVPRLGLMLVNGQPKTTSEYIQASSRVGREMPGLVVTLLNPGKPRDRSHYEHFRSYHESIYRWVEPTSVTPFAVPVRDRALHALVVTLVRYWGDQSRRSSPAPPPPRDLQDRIASAILERVRRVDSDEHDATEAAIREIFARWERAAPSQYGGFRPDGRVVPLMHPDGSPALPEWDGRAYPTPTSMRSVDATCDLAVVARYPEV